MKQRPKTGEKRRTRHPLKIDQLPLLIRDRIVELRRPPHCRRWLEIEEMSPAFEEWKRIDPELVQPAKRLFPGLRLPHTNLQRWWDLRIEQDLVEEQKKREQFEGLVKALAEREGFDKLPEATRALLGEALLRVKETAGAGSPEFLKAVESFAWVISDLEKGQAKRDQIAIEREKLDLSRQRLEVMRSKILGLKKDAGEGRRKLKPEELQQKLDEIYDLTH